MQYSPLWNHQGHATALQSADRSRISEFGDLDDAFAAAAAAVSSASSGIPGTANATIRGILEPRGWTVEFKHDCFPQPPARGRRMAIDFFKNGVGVEVQIGHRDAVWRDLLKLQVAGSGGADDVEVGFIVVLNRATRTSKGLAAHYAEFEYSRDFATQLDSTWAPVPIRFVGL